MLKMAARAACILTLALAVAASPILDSKVGRRQANLTSWVTVTETLPAETVTYNPADTTSLVTLFVGTTWPFVTTSTTTYGCISYSEVFPWASTVPLATIPVTSTHTVRTKPTVTETRTDLPPKTVFGLASPVVTASTGLTLWSTSCTNTAVLSYYPSSTLTNIYTQANAYTRVTTTKVCMTTLTLSPAPTNEPPQLDIINAFSNTNMITISRPYLEVEYETVTADTMTTIETVCNNPSVVITERWYEVTETLATTTLTSFRSDCADPSEKGPPTGAPAPTASIGIASRGKSGLPAAGLGPRVVVLRDGELVSPAGAQADEEVMRMVKRQAPGVTGAAGATPVVEIRTVTFTTIVRTPYTVTATATETESVCPCLNCWRRPSATLSVAD